MDAADETTKTAAGLFYRLGELCELAAPGEQIRVDEAIAALRQKGMMAEADELEELVMHAESLGQPAA